MRRMSLVLLAVLFGSSCTAQAQEPPEKQLEFARKLRAKQFSDLALQYLEQLQKNPPAELAAVLPVELARTRLSMALEQAPDKRQKLLEDARKDLEAAAAKLGDSPDGVAIKLEIAKIGRYQAQALLSQASRQDDSSTAAQLSLKARAQFGVAEKDLKGAVAFVEGQYAKVEKGATEQEKQLAKELGEALLQSELELAKNKIDQALTYAALGAVEERAARGELLRQATKSLNKVATDRYDRKLNVSASYLADAWMMYCAQLSDDPKAAKDSFTKILTSKENASGIARRWAILFHVMNFNKEEGVPTLPNQRLLAKRKLCDDWFVNFPQARSAPEGLAMRYAHGLAYLESAKFAIEGLKDRKTLLQNKAILDQLGTAEKSFALLADGNNDFTERAKREIIGIRLLKLGERTSVAALNDFSDCLLKVQSEIAQLQRSSVELKAAPNPDERQKLAKTVQGHLKTIIEASQRGVKLAALKPPERPSEVEDIRYFMAYAYLMAGDFARAAVMGEAIARDPNAGTRGPLAAMYALQGYSTILTMYDDRANRDRLRDMAKYVLDVQGKKWADKDVVPTARYQLAQVCLRDKQYDMALEHLEQLPSSMSVYTFAQCQAVFAALAAREQPNLVEDKKPAYQQKALAALARAGELPANTDSATLQMYFAAQLEKGKILYAQGFGLLRVEKKPDAALAKLDEMRTFARKVEVQFAAACKTPAAEGVTDKAKDDMQTALASLTKYARYGLAEIEYRRAQYDKVLSPELTGAVVADVKALAKDSKEKTVKIRDVDLAGNILGLALRAYVQKGQINEAKEVLTLMQNLANADGVQLDPTASLRALLGEVQAQVKELRATGAADRLKLMMSNFATFFDALAQNQKALDRTTLLFLATSYTSLEQHAKAAAIYSKFEAPKDDPATIADKDQKDKVEQDVKMYWMVQIYYARALRHAKDISTARKVIFRVLNEPKATSKFLAEKEDIHLLAELALEKQELWGNVVTKWSQYMANPTFKRDVDKNPTLKEIYFDCYFHFAVSCYRYSQTPKVKGTPREAVWIKKAVDQLVNLERRPESYQLIAADVRQFADVEPLFKGELEKAKKAVAMP